jgi:hypothetical protein
MKLPFKSSPKYVQLPTGEASTVHQIEDAEGQVYAVCPDPLYAEMVAEAVNEYISKNFPEGPKRDILESSKG